MSLKVRTGNTKPKEAGIAGCATDERCTGRCGGLSAGGYQMRRAAGLRRDDGCVDYTQQEAGCSGKCSRLDTAGKYSKLEQQVSAAGRHLGGSQQTGQSRMRSQGW